jgi:hypothetical protein
MSDEFLLSTEDNPFDPYTQWVEWYTYDEQHGYCTSGLIARIIITSDDLSDEDKKLAYEQAADAIIANIDDKLYVKVPRPVEA